MRLLALPRARELPLGARVAPLGARVAMMLTVASMSEIGTERGGRVAPDFAARFRRDAFQRSVGILSHSD
jgi:hypothetical protein